MKSADGHRESEEERAWLVHNLSAENPLWQEILDHPMDTWLDELSRAGMIHMAEQMEAKRSPRPKPSPPVLDPATGECVADRKAREAGANSLRAISKSGIEAARRKYDKEGGER